MDDMVKLLWDISDRLAKTKIMYLNFYNFTQPPFQLTPDPNFLVLSPTHNEALLSLIYGIENRKGFVVLLGEVGTGKTTIIRSYLESRELLRLKQESSIAKTTIYKSLFDRFDFKKVKPIYIFFTSNLVFPDILKTISQELNFTYEDNSLLGMVRQLNQVLLEEYQQENYVALIIDEAQNMSVEALEQLRMLSNLETNQEKLIQVVLVGQPELGEKLNREGLRQLKQRIEIQSVLKPLSYKQSVDYIEHRLSRVMTESVDVYTIFANPTLKEIIRLSKGIPRLLNVLCDKVLIAGYNFQKKPIPLKIAEKVLPTLEERRKPISLLKKWIPAVIVILAGAGLAVGYRDPLINQIKAVSSFLPAPLHTKSIEKKEAAHLSTPIPENKENHNPGISVVTPTITSQGINEASDAGSITTPTPVPMESRVSSATKTGIVAETITAVTPATAAEANIKSLTDSPTLDSKNRKQELKIKRDLPYTRIIEPGDSLASLCVEMYGICNSRVISHIRKFNPQITDVNLILVGDKIVFPPLPSASNSLEVPSATTSVQ